MSMHLRSRHWVSCFVGLLVVCAAPLIQSAQQQQPAQESRSSANQVVARIPFELDGNHIFLQGRVNDSAPLWFTLDTGAYNSVINLRQARELGLKLEGGHHATGAGGTVESARISGVGFKFPGAELSDLTIAALPLDSIETSAGRSMDIILGSEFFRKYTVEIDYAAKIINLYDPQRFEYRGSGESLPLTFFDNHPYVRARVAVAGREPIEGEFVIDAGSGLPLILLNSFVEQHQLLKDTGKVVETRGRGVGGEVRLPIGRVKSLQLGRFQLASPVTAFPPAGTFARRGAAGNIGGAILRRFRVIFDYSRRRMILEPARSFADPFDYDMSGVSLVSDSPHFKNVKVLRVVDNSPAAEAGLKPDDLLVAVDGRPVSEFRLADLREMFRREGSEYQLKVRRGEESLQLRLKTRRLI